MQKNFEKSSKFKKNQWKIRGTALKSEIKQLKSVKVSEHSISFIFLNRPLGQVIDRIKMEAGNDKLISIVVGGNKCK